MASTKEYLNKEFLNNNNKKNFLKPKIDKLLDKNDNDVLNKLIEIFKNDFKYLNNWELSKSK